MKKNIGFLKQPFFKMIGLFRHLFSHSTFDVGRSMFDVHFFPVLPAQKQLSAYGDPPRSMAGDAAAVIYPPRGGCFGVKFVEAA